MHTSKQPCFTPYFSELIRSIYFYSSRWASTADKTIKYIRRVLQQIKLHVNRESSIAGLLISTRQTQVRSMGLLNQRFILALLTCHELILLKMKKVVSVGIEKFDCFSFFLLLLHL